MTIGLGVGPNLAAFALLHDAFFPPTPYHEAIRLAIVENRGLYYYEGNVPEGLESPMVSGPDFEDFLARQQVFEAVGAVVETIAVMGGTDRPRTVSRVFVTPTALDALRPQLVRGPLVTEGLWRTRLASDPAVIGRSITLDEQPFTIAGVLPDQVFGLLVPRRGLFDQGAHDRSVVTPLVRGRAGEGERSLAYSRTHRDAPWLRVVGRLGPGVSMERARTETAALATRLRAENPSANRSRSLQVVPLDRWRTADVRQLLLMLSLAAGLAFLVAVANAAGLMMTDSVKRQPELAIRQALGAGPAQLLRVMLVRSVLWSLPGAVLGYVFGVAALAFVRWSTSAPPGL